MGIKRGDIYYIESGYATVGSEQRPGRPAIVVSNDRNNEHSSTLEVVYLTTQPKHDLPTHVTIRSTSPPLRLRIQQRSQRQRQNVLCFKKCMTLC